MQIKKLQWINRPAKARILSSREIMAESESRHALVYTYEEEQEISITFSSDREIRRGIALILTPEAGFSIMDESGTLTIESNILGVRSRTLFHADSSDTFTVGKKGSTLTFHYGKEEIYSFTFGNISASVSIAAVIEGKGAVKIAFSTR